MMIKISHLFSKQWVRWLACLLASLGLGAALSAGFGQGSFLTGWLGTTVILFVSLGLMLWAWQWAKGDRLLAWMMILAFVLRLSIGVALTWALPRFGYDTPVDKAGYVFADAYTRDSQAWTLATSHSSLVAAFRQEFISDQYGGLLALSAGVYRVFSPDVQRPYLIIILAAAAAALGLPFLWVSLRRRRWGEAVAQLAGWIMVLYPESVLLGSSQMREPFLISLVAVAFCMVLSWNFSSRKPALAAGFIASMVGMLLFSSRTALPVLAICALFFLLERASQPSGEVWHWFEWVALAVGGVAVIALTWEWLHTTAQWGVLQMLRTSGMVQGFMKGVPAIIKSSFVISYGLAQPVLPAAVVDPAAMLWRIISILRALGWYTLAPLLIYALFIVWKAKEPGTRRLMICMAVVVWGWILVSSARSGGNQWDNPRYRTIFLIWMAILAAWTWNWVREHHDVWLGRLVAVELVCVGFFFAWYAARYYRWFEIMPFDLMIGLIIFFSLLILVGGWAWDHFIVKKRI
jgi:hypothetical protein